MKPRVTKRFAFQCRLICTQVMSKLKARRMRTASAGLHLGNGGLVGLTGRVKTKYRRAKIDLKWRRRICIGCVCCHFEYAINDADVATSVSGATNLYPSYGTTKMHMGVQAGAEPMNKGHRADTQCCRVS